MVTRGHLRGFTLIELLISITILGLLVGLASYSFSLFSRNWEKPRSTFELAAGQMQRLDLVSRAVNDCLPWVVKEDSGRPGFYFLGREEGLTLVTSSPVYATGAPAVIRLFREQQSADRWRLVYEEASLAKVVLREASQNLPFDRRLVVLENLPRISFRYLGWLSTTDRYAGADLGMAVPPSWFNEFDGLARIQQPQRIALQMGDFEAAFIMPERTRILLNRATAQQ